MILGIVISKDGQESMLYVCYSCLQITLKLTFTRSIPVMLLVINLGPFYYKPLMGSPV